jgi:hypothetical protein
VLEKEKMERRRGTKKKAVAGAIETLISI